MDKLGLTASQTSQLNKHLSSYMPGLTAKVFRTYNASYTMSTLLQKLHSKKNISDAEKVKIYNDCNRQVAILCNHKRSVGASHDAQMKKLGDRILGLKYQQWRTKMMMIDLDPKLKKKKGAQFFERIPELTDEWVKEHQAFLVEEKRAAITKKFEKDNEKAVANGEKKMPEKELKERLKAASEMDAMYKKENKTKKVLAEGRGVTVEKLEQQVKKLDERIRTMELQAADRDGNKEVALGTSKIVSELLEHCRCSVTTITNYMTPKELHRSSSYCCLLQQDECTHRKVLFQNVTGEVQLGYSIRWRRRRVGVLSLSSPTLRLLCLSGMGAYDALSGQTAYLNQPLCHMYIDFCALTSADSWLFPKSNLF